MVVSCGDYDMDQQRSVAMAHCVSEDDGLTWKMLDPIPVTCVMPLTTLVVLKSGELFGLYNDRWPELQKRLAAERGRQTWRRSSCCIPAPGGTAAMPPACCCRATR